MRLWNPFTRMEFSDENKIIPKHIVDRDWKWTLLPIYIYRAARSIERQLVVNIVTMQVVTVTSAMVEQRATSFGQ
jgi:hypothetical protein